MKIEEIEEKKNITKYRNDYNFEHFVAQRSIWKKASFMREIPRKVWSRTQHYRLLTRI